MRDWAQAHYRSAERYARSRRRWQGGVVKKELGRLLGKKGAEKHGKRGDDKPVPDVPNVQATHTVAKRAPGVPNVRATHTVPNVLNAGDDNLPLILNDTQGVVDKIGVRTGESIEHLAYIERAAYGSVA